MKQQHIRVSFPLGTKLLISIVTLLLIVIGFLDFSTIVILKEDKQAYTYQAQSTEALLAGSQFLYVISKGIDTLRLALGSIDPLKPVTPHQQESFKSLVDNQTDIVGIDIRLVNPVSKSELSIIDGLQAKVAERLSVKAEDIRIPKEWIELSLPSIERNGYALMNLSKVGFPPLIGLAVADLASREPNKGFPIAFGVAPLEGFEKNVRSSRISITNNEGWVLFDSDAAILYGLNNIGDDPLFEAANDSKLASGALAYDSEGTDFLGSYYKPGLGISVLASTKWKTAMRATYTLTEKFILLGIMAIGAAILFAILFAKGIAAPLNQLYEATKEVATGNFDLELKTKSRDEIGALSGSFNVMSKKIQELIEATKETTRLEGELAIASTVQQTLIPPKHFKNKNIIIRSHYQSASECGGDWWGFFGVGDRMAVLIADATGHGLPCALITAAARSCVSVMHKLAQEDVGFTFAPGSMLAYANRVVHDAASGKIMMTFFAGVFDFKERTFSYSSAGHNPPWLYTMTNGKYEMKSLVSKGQRLGESRDIEPYEEKTIPINDNDILFLYTDGLMEGTNLSHDQYGKKRVRHMIDQTLPKGIDEAADSLIGDFMNHNKNKSLDDDITIAFARVMPPSSIGMQ